MKFAVCVANFGTYADPRAVGPDAMAVSPDELAAKARAVGGEVACNGYWSARDSRLVAEYAEAGATWRLENFHDRRCGLEDVLARISAGPARL